MSEETKVNMNFSGKIAIATDDQLRVTGHLGRCRAFMVYEINDNKIMKKELRENVFTHHRMGHAHQHHGESGGHNHNHLIEGLKDCKFLISSGGGWRVVEDLKQHNITTVFSDVELIDDAVNMFIKGELENDAELTCRHD